MAYSGSTAASSVANPPQMIWAGHMGGGGWTTAPSTTINLGATYGSSVGSRPGRALSANGWYYASTDTTTASLAAGYFTDGKALGMQPGDVIFVVGSASAGSSATFAIGVIGDVTSTGASIGVGGSTGSQLSSTR